MSTRDERRERHAVTLHAEGGNVYGDLRITGFASSVMPRRVVPAMVQGLVQAHAERGNDVEVTVYYDGAECEKCP